MTSYDRDKEIWTVIASVSITLPVYVNGSADAVDARSDAVKALEGQLATKLDSIVVSDSDYPIHPEVTLGLADDDAIEVEVL